VKNEFRVGPARAGVSSLRREHEDPLFILWAARISLIFFLPAPAYTRSDYWTTRKRSPAYSPMTPSIVTSARSSTVACAMSTRSNGSW